MLLNCYMYVAIEGKELQLNSTTKANVVIPHHYVVVIV